MTFSYLGGKRKEKEEKSQKKLFLHCSKHKNVYLKFFNWESYVPFTEILEIIMCLMQCRPQYFFFAKVLLWIRQ